MPYLTILSIFRQSEGYLQRYLDQVERAFDLIQKPCRAVWLEGDSTDQTYTLLQEAKERFESKGHTVTLIQFPIGGIKWESTNAPSRWNQIATCWNRCLQELTPSDFTICVESDLIWPADIVQKLSAKLDANHHVVAPMLMIDQSEKIMKMPWFYDIWGFSRGGKKFRSTWPYWVKDTTLIEEKELLQVQTAGGMLVSTYPHQSKAHWDLNTCIMKYSAETRIFMDKTLKIYHPAPLQWYKFGKVEIILKKIKHLSTGYCRKILGV